MAKILTGFTLEYRADILLHNSPDKRYGIKGKVKNFVQVFSDGKIVLDFFGNLFPRQPFSAIDSSKVENILEALGSYIQSFPNRAENSSPCFGYAANYVRFVFSDGKKVKFMLDGMEEAALLALKKLINAFLADYGLKLDIGERLPQGTVRYLGVVTEKSSKEYSYLWDGEIEAGAKVLIPFGEENERVYGKVTSIEYYRTTAVPYRIERMKKIIRIENS